MKVRGDYGHEMSILDARHSLNGSVHGIGIVVDNEANSFRRGIIWMNRSTAIKVRDRLTKLIARMPRRKGSKR